MSYKDKTVLVATHALFASQAERFARDFGRVLLFVPWNSFSFPTLNVGMVGHGIPEVERVESIFGKHFDEVDLWVFPDLYFSAEQIYLESLGKRVWGARNGEELETYRETCKEVMQEIGLPVQPWKKIKGMDALREYLMANENSHVKIDKWRGNFETFKSENYSLVESKLDDIANTLGAFRHEAEFIVEDDLSDCVEVGLDTYCIDGEHPTSTLVGIEVKDLGFCGEFMAWEKIPEPIRRWNEAMAPTLARYGYRGWLSNEIRIDEKHDPYMIDATCRTPSPPGELCQEFYTNWCDIIWHGAEGVLVDPEPIAKFGVQVVMKSDWAESHWQQVEYDEQFARQIKLFNPVVIDGKRYVVPQDEQMKEIGAVIGWGATLEEAIAHMQKAADTVKGHGIKIPHGAIEDAQAEMQKLKEFGVSPFSIDKTPA